MKSIHVLAVIMMARVCGSASFLFFHSPEPMSHATVLHTVTRCDGKSNMKLFSNVKKFPGN